jgi:hypothetical protein
MRHIRHDCFYVFIARSLCWREFKRVASVDGEDEGHTIFFLLRRQARSQTHEFLVFWEFYFSRKCGSYFYATCADLTGVLTKSQT